MSTNFKNAEKFIQRKRNEGYESLCGPGSHLLNAKETIIFINNFLTNYNIKSMLDLGCGDWNWFKNIELNDIKYEGWDACDTMISDNRTKFGRHNIQFFKKDIISENYNTTDAIICRDVLFHLTVNNALTVIEKVKKSCKYFITTSFNDVSENIGIGSKGWGFYRINTNIKPFNLQNHLLDSIVEPLNRHGGYTRSINLYEFNT
jgi:SAM-dependent methyltransferase